MIDEKTKALLREYARQYETSDFIVGDPSWWMHQVEGDANREATAFVASVLSYGSRQQFMPKIGLLLNLAGGDMDRWLRSGGYAEHFNPHDRGCFYRLYCNATMRSFFDAYRLLLDGYGTLGEYVRQCCPDGSGLAVVEAICAYFAGQGVSVVVPKDTTSACKRVCMFLRWMVRSCSPVDLGLWADFIDRRTLIVPLDTHVATQSVRLGLLASKCASMSAARRLSATLSTIFPDDPLRGDFALFGYGVNHAD